jgi:hypothetical protein
VVVGDTDAKTLDERPGSGEREKSGADTVSERRGDRAKRPTHDLPALPARYVLKDELGRGGMGRVVEALDGTLGRTVAVKQALSTDDDILRRFKRETMITARLEHPSIVPVYDAGRADDGTPYYVMRKLSGRRLDALVADADTLDRRLALLPHVLAAAQAVAHAHARGIVHRDIKPSNILLGEHGETIVIDWGLAKVIGENEPDDAHVTNHDPGGSLRTRIGTVFGTPGFMSPEQVRSETIDARSDVYALGATLYYVLARRPPHEAASEDLVMEATGKGAAPTIDSLVEGVPPELATICEKAVAFHHAERYRDAGELADDLRQFLAGQLVASHHYSPREMLVRFIRKNRVALAVTALAVAALVIGGVIAVRGIVAARDEALQQSELALVAREREETRANEVTLGQARLLLESNPTAAAALVRPLARSAHWRQARAVAADAQAAGVAWRLPGEHMRNVELLPEGMHALAASDGGAVWLYDLKARTGRQVAKLDFDPILRVLSPDLALGTKVKAPATTVIDIQSGKTTPLQITEPIKSVRTFGGTTWIVGTEGSAWRFVHATRALEPITFPQDKLRVILPSPDGTQVAYGCKTGVWLVKEGAEPERLIEGQIHELAWSDDGKRLAGIASQEAFDIILAPSRAIWRSRTTSNLDVELVEGAMYMSGIAGVSVDGVRPAGWAGGMYMLGIHPTAGGAVVVGDETKLAIVLKLRRHDLRSPLVPITDVAASKSSHYIVSVARGALLLWDVSPIVPVSYDSSADATVAFAHLGPHGMLAAHGPAPADWIDLASGKRTRAPQFGLTMRAAAGPSGNNVLVLEREGRALLTKFGTSETMEIGTDVVRGTFADDQRVVLGSRTGEVRLYEVASRSTRVLTRRDGTAVSWIEVPHSRRWLVAAFADGTLWRIELATGAQSTWRLASLRSSSEVAVLDDGRVFFADSLGDKERLLVWRPDGTASIQALLPEPIVGLFEVDDRRLLTYTPDGDGYYVDASFPNLIEPTIAISDYSLSLALDADMLAFPRPGAGLVVLDHPANASFRVARLLSSEETATLTRDGRYVVSYSRGSLATWRLELPSDAEATGAWIDGLTNAATGRGAALAWQ